MKGLHLWLIRLGNCNVNMNVLTRYRSPEQAIKKASSLIRTDAQFYEAAIESIEYQGTIDA